MWKKLWLIVHTYKVICQVFYWYSIVLINKHVWLVRTQMSSICVEVSEQTLLRGEYINHILNFLWSCIYKAEGNVNWDRLHRICFCSQETLSCSFYRSWKTCTLFMFMFMCGKLSVCYRVEYHMWLLRDGCACASLSWEIKWRLHIESVKVSHCGYEVPGTNTRCSGSVCG